MNLMFMQQFSDFIFDVIADSKANWVMCIQHKPTDFNWIIFDDLFKSLDIKAMLWMFWNGDDF